MFVCYLTTFISRILKFTPNLNLAYIVEIRLKKVFSPRLLNEGNVGRRGGHKGKQKETWGNKEKQGNMGKRGKIGRNMYKGTGKKEI